VIYTSLTAWGVPDGEGGHTSFGAYKPWPALPSPVVGYNVEVLDNPGGPEVEVPCGGGPLDVLEDQSLLSLGLGDPVVGLGSPVVHQGTFAAFALEFLYREHP